MGQQHLARVSIRLRRSFPSSQGQGGPSLHNFGHAVFVMIMINGKEKQKGDGSAQRGSGKNDEQSPTHELKYTLGNRQKKGAGLGTFSSHLSRALTLFPRGMHCTPRCDSSRTALNEGRLVLPAHRLDRGNPAPSR